MPICELFARQPAAYRDSLLPPEVRARVAAEEASSRGLHRSGGSDGAAIAMHTFGASAPLEEVQTKKGPTPDKRGNAARHQIAQQRQLEAAPNEAQRRHPLPPRDNRHSLSARALRTLASADRLIPAGHSPQ